MARTPEVIVAQETTKDVFLDADGKVVEAKDAVKMRRTVTHEDGTTTTSVWFAKGAEPTE